jgi:hypothetical protein
MSKATHYLVVYAPHIQPSRRAIRSLAPARPYIFSFDLGASTTHVTNFTYRDKIFLTVFT